MDAVTCGKKIGNTTKKWQFSYTNWSEVLGHTYKSIHLTGKPLRSSIIILTLFDSLIHGRGKKNLYINIYKSFQFLIILYKSKLTASYKSIET